MSNNSQQSIAIIGGGFTGLVAAYRLAQTGCDVTLFERGGDLGGLASGFKIEGTNLERAYHHLFQSDRNIINLVYELGLTDKLKWYDSSVAVYLNDKLYPFTTPFDLLKFTPLPFFSRIRLGLVSLYLKYEKNWRKYIRVSAYTWMEKWAGKKAMEVIWKPILKGKFHQFYDKVSMAWLWARLHIRVNSRQGGGTIEKLGYFDGGFNVVVQALVEKLKSYNVQIKINIGISALKAINNEVEITAGEEKYLFSKAIATVPSHVFAKLVQNNDVSPRYLEQLNSIQYLGAICLIFTSQQKISDYYWHNINQEGMPFVVFIHHTALMDKASYGGQYVYYLGSYLPHEHEFFAMDEKEVFEKWFEALRILFPQFNIDEVQEKYLFKFKNAQHIVDLDYESKIPDYETPVKNVYLSNFSQIFPEDRGTNYAVREGEKIAKQVVDSRA